VLRAVLRIVQNGRYTQHAPHAQAYHKCKLRRYTVKGRGIRDAALKSIIHRGPRGSAAVRIHGDGQLSAPPHAALVPAAELPVAAHDL